jgi:hypothetical protein
MRKHANKVKLRVPILVFDEDGENAVTNCPGCKEEIQLPIVLKKGAIPNEVPLVLSKRYLTPPPDDP